MLMNSRLVKIFDLVGQQFEGFSMTTFLFVIAIGVSVVYGGMLLYEKRRRSKIDKKKKRAYLGLVIYISFVLQITCYRREPGSRYGIVTSLQDMPLLLRDTEQMIYQLLNVVLFIPFGIILAVILGEICGWKRMAVIIGGSYIFSLWIELTQLFSQRGYFEVTDLLMNVLGGILGGVIGNSLRKD